MLELEDCVVYYGTMIKFEDCANAVLYIALAKLERFYATPFTYTFQGFPYESNSSNMLGKLKLEAQSGNFMSSNVSYRLSGLRLGRLFCKGPSRAFIGTLKKVM